MDSLGIEKAALGGYDWGGRAACIVSALWPERVIGLVSAGAGYNIQDIVGAAEPGSPDQEARNWYQYYFHTERGRKGLHEKRRDISKYLWRAWSPSWSFDDETFERSAASFDNPDFVEVVIHSYRHRYGVISGDPADADIWAQLSRQPDIAVPTVVLLGADDGVDPPPSEDKDDRHFTASYARHILPDVGHSVPQEVPAAFADAIREVAQTD